MKKTISILAFALIPFFAISQQLNQVVMDTTINKNILYGYCDRTGLETTFFSEHFHPYYDTYDPQQEMIQNLQPLMEGVYMTVVFGSWCSDSQIQIPHFYKIIDILAFPSEEISLIGLNRQKEFEEIDTKIFDIQLVPTFIILKNGKEIGRIIESPIYTLEEDLFRILSGQEL